MSNLSGKFAVVTGGGKGIGEAVVRRFVAEKVAGVAIWDYDTELANRTAERIGGNIIVIGCDVSQGKQVEAAFEQTMVAFGRIDILVNNAGITRDAMFHKMTDEQWDAVIKTNLNGVYHCCKYVIPSMREQTYGKIVNLASTAAYGNAGQANYSATKGAVISLTKTLAKELAGKGITANAIAPAMIDTDMMRAVPPEILKRYISGIPAGRLGTTDELASAVYFLSCDDSSFVNGIVLDVNGGTHT